jgi:ferredoxin
MCGPPPMMTSLTEGLAEWGVPDANVHFEAFGPASAKKTAPPAAAEAAAGASITVTFDKSGVSVPWTGEAGSLLDLAEDNDVTMDSGCRAGNCGTCVTAIKSGDVTYLHEPGEMPRGGTCLSCITVPKGDITLDA